MLKISLNDHYEAIKLLFIQVNMIISFFRASDTEENTLTVTDEASRASVSFVVTALDRLLHFLMTLSIAFFRLH